MNAYYYLLENNLLNDFIMNFTIRRHVTYTGKAKISECAYYKEEKGANKKIYDRVPLNIYKWNYEVITNYMIFGQSFTTTQKYSLESSDDLEIPFGKKGFYCTNYANLGGYENSCYTLNQTKNVFSIYGKLSLLETPSNLKQLFEEDQELSKFIYMYYTVLKGKHIDDKDITCIKRIFEIEEEIRKLEKEKQELFCSLSDEVVLRK